VPERGQGPFRLAYRALPGELLPGPLRIVRGITLKGSGFRDVAGELAWLGGILMALFVLASSRFSKKLA